MTDTLEAQARQLVDTWTDDGEWISDSDMATSIAAWARRLLTESRAGALREAIAVVEDRELTASLVIVLGHLRALAAESERDVS